MQLNRKSQDGLTDKRSNKQLLSSYDKTSTHTVAFAKIIDDLKAFEVATFKSL